MARQSRKTPPEVVIPFLEEIFTNAKRVPFSGWIVYFGATFPFIVAAIYFWYDMAHDSFAQERLALEAALLTVLFIIMKTGHAMFARHASAAVAGGAISPEFQVGHVMMNQAILQPAAFILLPLSLLFLVPFGQVYAFFQNLTVLDDGTKPMKELRSDAWSLARRKPRQNHLLIWLLCPHGVSLAVAILLILIPIWRIVTPVWSDFYLYLFATIGLVLVTPLCPFGMMIALNIGATLLFVPAMLETLLGIETAFTISGFSFTNPSLLAVICALTYLFLDPLMKIAYCMRCFEGHSVESGRDILVRLDNAKRRAAAWMLIFATVSTLAVGNVHAQTEDTVSSTRSEELGVALGDVLRDRRFSWRIPRERPETDRSGIFGAAQELTAGMRRWFRDRMDDIRDWFSRRDTNQSSGSPPLMSSDAVRGIVIVLCVVLVVVLAYIAYQTWRKNPDVHVDATPIETAVPDVADENTTAEELPPNEWLQLARELMENGDVRLATRAYYFAGLAHLSHRKLIRLAPYKSNREYQRELQRIGHAKGELLDVFSGNMRTFESVWYGDHALNEESLHRYISGQERVMRNA